MDENATHAKTLTLSALACGQIDVFDALFELDRASSLAGKQRKDGGVVYTPKAIAMRMCALAQPSLDDKVLEPSCGRGAFVFALAEHHLLAGITPDEVASALSRNLRACELDPEAAEDLAKLWIAYWKSKGVDAPALAIKSEDSLFEGFSKESFDLILGNPPYVRFQNLPSDCRDKLQARFSSCASGNVDLYFAFIELGLEQAKRVCYITPNSWMGSKSGEALRALLRPRIEKLIDFGDALVFAPARAYSCVMLAAQAPQSSPIMLSHGGESIKSKQPTPAGLPESWEIVERCDPRLDPKAWSIRVAKASAQAKAGSKTICAPARLGDICSIHSGIATLSDSSYCLRASIGEDGLARFFDTATGAALAIDQSLCPKRIKLTKCMSEADISGSNERILLPYGKDSSLISEQELAKRHPSALSFLLARKDRLALRDRGKQEDYEAWHAYGRKQGLRPLPKGQLIALPIMSNNGLRHFALDTANTGAFLFTSGFILAPKPGSSADEIAKALSHPASWAWILAHGKQWAGRPGDHYMTYGARLIAQLPIPISESFDCSPSRGGPE